MIREIRTILLVEDSLADAEMTIDALREAKLANPIVHVEDGVEALDYLFAAATFADRAERHSGGRAARHQDAAPGRPRSAARNPHEREVQAHAGRDPVVIARGNRSRAQLGSRRQRLCRQAGQRAAVLRGGADARAILGGHERRASRKLIMSDATAKIRVLIVEDSELDAELVVDEIVTRRLRDRLRCASTASASSSPRSTEFAPDIIISDLSMPDFSGYRALELLRERAPDTPFIFVSGTMGEEAAVEAVRRGATDYVLKHNLARLACARCAARLREAEERAGALAGREEPVARAALRRALRCSPRASATTCATCCSRSRWARRCCWKTATKGRARSACWCEDCARARPRHRHSMLSFARGARIAPSACKRARAARRRSRCCCGAACRARSSWHRAAGYRASSSTATTPSCSSACSISASMRCRRCRTAATCVVGAIARPRRRFLRSRRRRRRRALPARSRSATPASA